MGRQTSHVIVQHDDSGPKKPVRPRDPVASGDEEYLAGLRVAVAAEYLAGYSGGAYWLGYYAQARASRSHQLLTQRTVLIFSLHQSPPLQNGNDSINEVDE